MRLSVRNVGKLYQGRVRALDDFSLDVEPGVLGLLGPNGAGKSTLMKILATITRPTTGTVTWNGEDVLAHPDPLRAVLGYLPQDFGVYPHLDAVEFLEYLAAVKQGPTKVRMDYDAEHNPRLHYPGDYNILVPGHRDLDYREGVFSRPPPKESDFR